MLLDSPLSSHPEHRSNMGFLKDGFYLPLQRYEYRSVHPIHKQRHKHTPILQSAHALLGSCYSFHLWFPLRIWWVGNMKEIQWTEERAILSLRLLACPLLPFSPSLFVYISSFQYSGLSVLFSVIFRSSCMSGYIVFHTCLPFITLCYLHIYSTWSSPPHIFSVHVLVFYFLLFLFVLFSLVFPSAPIPSGLWQIVEAATWEWRGRRSAGLNTEWSTDCLKSKQENTFLQ